MFLLGFYVMDHDKLVHNSKVKGKPNTIFYKLKCEKCGPAPEWMLQLQLRGVSLYQLCTLADIFAQSSMQNSSSTVRLNSGVVLSLILKWI